jgi:hypothetical protein
MDQLFGQTPLRNARPLIRIWRVRRHVDRTAELRAVNDVVEAVRRTNAELRGVEPQIAARDPPHAWRRLIVENHRRLRRRLYGPNEIRAIRVVGFAAFDWCIAKVLDERLAKLW